MAPPKEQSESAHPLPRPDLNPLMNPVLAENMGKWAEVYFTSPPEKREEAVQELVRQLESGETIAESVAKPAPPSALPSSRFPDEEYPAPAIAGEDTESRRHCDACGHDNPTTHQFCGMCGERLSPEDATAELRDGAHDGPITSSGVFSDAAAPDESGDAQVTPARFEHEIAPIHARGEAFEETDELARLRRISHGTPHESAGSSSWNLEDSPSRSYRAYVGAALAIVLLAVGYLVWHGSQAPPSVHRAAPAPAPSAPTSALPPTPITTPEVETPPARTTPAEPAPAPPVAASSSSAPSKPSENAAAVELDKKLPAGTEPVALGNGADELAIAQRYLSGGNGVQRNSGEAAQWLWKSIAKHNSEATILLADLYLKGDGVAKNCDQARVLLDSAARKGVSGAGERLRNLQAFGCQ